MKHQLSVFNYSIRNESESEADIYIDGYIIDEPTLEIYREWWGDNTSVSFKSIREQILNSTAKRFNVYVNSGGGHVADAMAIHDLFVDLQGKGYTINTHVRGICASAATYIAMAGNPSSMSENSWFMIHNVSGGVWGDVNTIENYAASLRKFNDGILNFYTKRTNLSETDLKDLMDKETWFTADEAKEHGFVNEITGTENFSNSFKDSQWQFRNREVLNIYNSFTKTPHNMDLKKVTEAIENGFKNLAKNLGIANKLEDEAGKKELTAFTEGISNALKDVVPTQEAINEMVNKALTANAEADATAIENAIKEGTKNFVKKEDLSKEVENLTEEVTKALGNGSGNKKEKENKTPSTKPANRFSERQWFSGE